MNNSGEHYHICFLCCISCCICKTFVYIFAHNLICHVIQILKCGLCRRVLVFFMVVYDKVMENALARTESSQQFIINCGATQKAGLCLVFNIF